MKSCTKCKVEQPLDNYQNRVASKDGKSFKCKSCLAKGWAIRAIRDKEKIDIKNKKYREDNKEKTLEAGRRHREMFPDRNKEQKRKWKQHNKAKVNADTRLYNIRKAMAVPKWVDGEELFLIEEVYKLSHLRRNLTGVEHHVDHIVPLNGKSVCGLHTIDNLQVIPASENLSKSNTFLID